MPRPFSFLLGVALLLLTVKLSEAFIHTTTTTLNDNVIVPTRKDSARLTFSATNTKIFRRTKYSSAATMGLPMTIVPEPVSALVTANLQAGPAGVLALSSIAAAICLPISQIKAMYVISVGYGASIATMAVILRNVMENATSLQSLGGALTASAIFYGIRLAVYLLGREVTGWKPDRSSSSRSRIQRIPLALSVSLFYGCLMTPALYLLRSSCAPASVWGTPSATALSATNAVWRNRVCWGGVGIAWTGALVEAIADTHKYLVKQSQKKAQETNETEFHGPVGGLYRLSRHPNYLGEVLFWEGVFVAGVPTLGRSVVAWLSSLAGLYGIVSIMRAATSRLEERQAEKYSGQAKFDEWRAKVTAPLFPFF